MELGYQHTLVSPSLFLSWPSSWLLYATTSSPTIAERSLSSCRFFLFSPRRLPLGEHWERWKRLSPACRFKFKTFRLTLSNQRGLDDERLVETDGVSFYGGRPFLRKRPLRDESTAKFTAKGSRFLYFFYSFEIVLAIKKTTAEQGESVQNDVSEDFCKSAKKQNRRNVNRNVTVSEESPCQRLRVSFLVFFFNLMVASVISFYLDGEEREKQEDE